MVYAFVGMRWGISLSGTLTVDLLMPFSNKPQILRPRRLSLPSRLVVSWWWRQVSGLQIKLVRVVGERKEGKGYVNSPTVCVANKVQYPMLTRENKISCMRASNDARWNTKKNGHQPGTEGDKNNNRQTDSGDVIGIGLSTENTETIGISRSTEQALSTVRSGRQSSVDSSCHLDPHPKGLLFGPH